MSGRKRILFCALATYSLIGGLQGFNRRVIANLAERAKTRGDVALDGLFLRDATTPDSGCADVKLRGIGSSARFMVEALAQARRADVLLLGHVNLLPVAALARLVRPSLPIILFVHGDEVWNDPRHRRKKPYDDLLVRLVTKIAAVSQFTATVMKREFHLDERITLLPNAVDPLAARGAPTKADLPTVLTVTRLSRADTEKNVAAVIKAAAELKKSLPVFRCEIVGDGDLRPSLEALMHDLGLADTVRFLGRVDAASLAAAYEKAWVFALPSTKEGFGIVYLEAWQHGLPVVCSNHGAPAGIIDDGEDGLHVDPADIAGLAARLRTLLTNPALAAQLGAAGRRKVEANYVNDVFRRNLFNLIDTALR